ncbi:MAG: protoporphyrinogen oxidase [Rhodospirillales bacterium]|nr:protoporphyrinogen oxidase [Rhodospirillales bacterium]
MSVDVAIVGGGVSGLVTAYGLARRGYAVAVLESRVRSGGNAVSERFGGFLMEHGPNSLNAATPGMLEISRDLGLERQHLSLGKGARNRYLVRDGALRRLAAHPFGLFTSDYLSPKSRLRVLAEPFIRTRPNHDEKTVAQFWGRRFGAEFANRVIDPLAGGLYGGEAERISMPATFPTIHEMERRYGSVTVGALRRVLAGEAMAGGKLFSWRDGVGALPVALTERLGAAVRTGVTARRVMRHAGAFRIDAGGAGVLDAAAVVVATQAHVAAGLVETVDACAADAAGSIEAPPQAVVFLGYERGQLNHPLDGLGYLSAKIEGRPLTGALFCSTMFANRAPAGHVALAGYVGGSRHRELALRPPAELMALARAEYRDLLGVTGNPVAARVRQWPRGLPQYSLGHRMRVAVLRGLEGRVPGFFVTGNYFAGPAVPICIAEARDTAERVHRHLAGRAGAMPAVAGG